MITQRLTMNYPDTKDGWVLRSPYKNKLRYTCIEYDGQQHFTSVDYWGGYKTLEKVKKNEMKLKINIAKKMVSV